MVTDGTVGPEGADWNAPVTVTLENANASITYDLGEPRQISAITMQGDANDTYKVMGSLDGSPASYKLIVELANVVNTGHGLRTRATSVTPTTVRYLRVGEANGDNYFSISEFGAYCKAPTPFPPGMKIVDVPPTATPDSQAPRQARVGHRPLGAAADGGRPRPRLARVQDDHAPGGRREQVRRGLGAAGRKARRPARRRREPAPLRQNDLDGRDGWGPPPRPLPNPPAMVRGEQSSPAPHAIT